MKSCTVPSHKYCTISINSSGGVTCDQLDEISSPASQHVTWDKPEISAKQANRLYSAKTFWMHGDDNSDKEKLRNAHLQVSLIISLVPIPFWVIHRGTSKRWENDGTFW